MAEPGKEKQIEPLGMFQWVAIALAIVITLGILALAVRAEKDGPSKPDRNRIFDNLKSLD